MNFKKAFRVDGQTDENNNNPAPTVESCEVDDDGDDGNDEEEQDCTESVEFVEAKAILDEDDCLEQLPKHHCCACHLLNLVSTVDVDEANINRVYKWVSPSAFSKSWGLWKKSARSTTEYAKTMSPVAKALDGETNVQMGWLVPTITLLKAMLQNLCISSMFGRPLIDALLSGLEKRFGQILTELELITTAILVPKFKTCWKSDQCTLKLVKCCTVCFMLVDNRGNPCICTKYL